MESAPYDSAKLQRSKERVELLGYFDNVNSMRFLWPIPLTKLT